MKTPTGVDEAKRALRREMRERLARLDPVRRAADSGVICRRLADSPGWNSAKVILGFAPMSTEPDILPALFEAVARGAAVCLPRWSPAASLYEAAEWTPGSPLHAGPFGVLEPLPASPAVPFEQLDLILVPGLAFDSRGRRLGRGRGFFDRLLSRAARAKKWGVGFDFQLVPAAPWAPHDANVDVVVTPGPMPPTPGGVGS